MFRNPTHIALIVHPVNVPADKGRGKIGVKNNAAPANRKDQGNEQYYNDTC